MKKPDSMSQKTMQMEHKHRSLAGGQRHKKGSEGQRRGNGDHRLVDKLRIDRDPSRGHVRSQMRM